MIDAQAEDSATKLSAERAAVKVATPDGNGRRAPAKGLLGDDRSDASSIHEPGSSRAAAGSTGVDAVQASRNEEAREGDMAIYRRTVSEIKRFWPHVTGLFLLGLAASGIALLSPLPMKIAVDSVLGSEPLPRPISWFVPAALDSTSDLLVVAAVLLVFTAALSQLETTATSILRLTVSQRVVLRLRSRLFEHAQRLSPSYHDSVGSSDSMYRIQYDAEKVPSIPIDTILPALTSATTVVTLAYVSFRIDWQLALIGFAGLPVNLWLSSRYRQRLRHQSEELRELESSALGVIQEVFTSLRVVKAFGQEHREHGRYLDTTERGVRARLRLAYMEGGFELLVGMASAATTAAILYVGVLHVQQDRLSLGSLLLVMGYLSQVFKPLKALTKLPAKLQPKLVSARRMYALLDQTPGVTERPNARSLQHAKGHIEMRNVSFEYTAANPVLRSVSFEVEPGTRVGIAGPTGAGKSTLVNLIMRFMDPTSGVVLLDGIDLRDVKLRDLRNQFSVVLQEPVLFRATLAENIAYARPDAGSREIVRAATAAGIHDFIHGLPDGYATMVGERGMNLSGGERQRMSLARAFLKESPILILDEPTSSVDIETEQVILEAMNELTESKTSFMIAHRLSTLETCQKVIVIDAAHRVALRSDAPPDSRRRVALPTPTK